MSQKFGEIRQIAFVVRSIDDALRYWTETLGVGPFFVMRQVTPDDWRYGGEPSPSPQMSIALANSGAMQVELIEQHDDSPSAYRDFLDSGHEGMHHVSSWTTRDEYDATMARMRDAGVAVAHEGAINTMNVRFAYFATNDAPGGLYYEMADLLEPPIYSFVEMIAGAARDWDGTDPIRNLG